MDHLLQDDWIRKLQQIGNTAKFTSMAHLKHNASRSPEVTQLSLPLRRQSPEQRVTATLRNATSRWLCQVLPAMRTIPWSSLGTANNLLAIVDNAIVSKYWPCLEAIQSKFRRALRFVLPFSPCFQNKQTCHYKTHHRVQNKEYSFAVHSPSYCLQRLIEVLDLLFVPLIMVLSKYHYVQPSVSAYKYSSQSLPSPLLSFPS